MVSSRDLRNKLLNPRLLSYLTIYRNLPTYYYTAIYTISYRSSLVYIIYPLGSILLLLYYNNLYYIIL